MANFVYYLGVRIIRIAGRRINDAMRVNRVPNDTELETGSDRKIPDDVQPRRRRRYDYNLVWI
jgi:hypothetical protein